MLLDALNYLEFFKIHNKSSRLMLDILYLKYPAVSFFILSLLETVLPRANAALNLGLGWARYSLVG